MTLINLCERLVKKGHQCIVLTINQENSHDIDESINGVEVRRIGSPISKYLYGLSPAIYRFIKNGGKALISKMDIVHIHCYSNLLSLEAVYLTQNMGKPVLFTPHYHPLGHTPFTNFLRKLYKPVGGRIFKRVDKVICVSERESMILQRDFPIDKSGIRVIPHGVGVSQIETRVRKGSSASLISLLYVGRLTEHKGVHHILAAMRKLIDVYQLDPRLEIIGYGPEKRALEHMAHDLGLENRILWNERVSEQDLWQRYEQADIFLLLSWAEAYGLVVAEALAYGTPCIVADTGALSEFVAQPGCFGVEYPPDPENLAALILRIHTSDIQIGPFDINKIRTWDRVVDEYEKLYQETIQI